MVKNIQEILNHAYKTDLECELTALRGQNSPTEPQAQSNGRKMADFREVFIP